MDLVEFDRLAKMRKEELSDAFGKLGQIQEKIRGILNENKYNVYREILDKFIMEKIQELRDLGVKEGDIAKALERIREILNFDFGRLRGK